MPVVSLRQGIGLCVWYVHVALSADSACRAQWLQLPVVRMGDGLNLKRIPRCDVVQVRNGQPSYLMSAEEEVAAAAQLGQLVQLVCGSAELLTYALR